MKYYTEDQIVEFLKAIDKHLTEPAELIIIGGTAATLAYKFKRATQDIDTANSIDKLTTAIKMANKETGFDIPISKSGVFDAPYEYESRLVPFEPSLFKKLSIKVPEAIDLIMMKMMRLQAHDIEAIKQIINEKSITIDQLLERFNAEMDHVIKSRSDVELHFLTMIETCFGEEQSSICKSKISKRK